MSQKPLTNDLKYEKVLARINDINNHDADDLLVSK